MSSGQMETSGWMEVEQLVDSHNEFLENSEVVTGVASSGQMQRDPGLETQEANEEENVRRTRVITFFQLR